LAPCLPRAVRVFLGKCEIVFFRRAARAAFLIFRFAAARCFLVVTSSQNHSARQGSSGRHERDYGLAATLSRARCLLYSSERERAERCFATRFACLDNARLDAERRLSRLRARFVAWERFAEGFLRRAVRPFVKSRLA